MANAATVGILRVILSADTAQYQAGMKRAADVAGALSKDWKSIGQQATQVGSALTKAFTVPLLGIGVGAAKLAIDFQSSFTNISKNVDGVADRSGKLTKVGEQLAMTFRQMAKEIPATTDELTKIAALGGQMGVPIEQLAHFTRNVAALGVAVDGISTEEAASGLAAIGNATGTGTTKIAEMASALTHLGANSNATEGDILEFTKRVIGAGHSVGMTVPEVMALGTAMANVGINAEAGGTAMSIVISKISNAVSKGGADLDEFAKVAGRSADEFAAVWKRSPIEAMDLFIKGLGNMRAQGVDLNLTMGEIGTEGVRVASTLKLLAGAGDGVAKSLVLANDGFAAGDKHLIEAEKKYGTVANKLTLLWNRIKDVGITLGNALLPAINLAIGGADRLIPVIDTLAKMFAAMPAGVQGVVIALGLLLAAVGPVIFIFGQMAISASALIGVFGKKGLATRALAVDQGTLAVASTKLTTSLGLLTKAASLASAALIGWEIGRLIAQLTGLDQKIADTITGLNNLTRARDLAAQGKSAEAQADVTARLTDLENKRKAAIIGLNFVTAALIAKQIEALKNDQTRLSIQDTINAAIGRGAAATITYTEAVKFNAEWDKKRTDGLTAQAAAQQAAGRATETAAQKLDRMAQAQAAISAANKLYAQELTGIKDALALQIQHMDETGKSTKDLAKEYGISETTVSRFKSELDKSEKSLVKTGKAASAVASALKELQNRIDGIPLVDKAKEWEAALKAPGMAAKVLADEGLRRELKDALDQVERKFGSLKAAGVGSLVAIHQAMKNMVVFAETIPPSIIPQMGATSLANLGEPQMINPIIPTISVDTESSILVAEQAASTFGTHFGQKLKANLSETIRNLPQLILESMKTGAGFGEVAGTIGIALGQDIGEAIGGPLGESFSNAITALITNTNVQQSVENLGIELGAAIGEAIGGALGGPIGAALGRLGGGIVGSFLDNIFKLGQRETNNRRDEFLASLGLGGTGTGVGSAFRTLADQLHTLGAAGDAMFQRLIRADDMESFAAAVTEVNAALKTLREESSEGLVEAAGFQTQAQLQAIADKAKVVYDTMLASGLYTAATLKEAWERYERAQEAALDIDPAVQKAKDAIKELDDELKGLYQSIENEAPEEVMGVIEANTRAHIDAVQKERDAAQQAMDAAAETSRKTTQTATEALALAAENAAKRIEDAFNGLYRDRPPIKFDAELHWGNFRPPSRPTPEPRDDSDFPQEPVTGFASGGIVPFGLRPPQNIAGGAWLGARGTDTVPAMLTPGEIVINAAQQKNIAGALTAHTPGLGSTVGAFVKLRSGGWVPKNHPLYLAELGRQNWLGARAMQGISTGDWMGVRPSSHVAQSEWLGARASSQSDSRSTELAVNLNVTVAGDVVDSQKRAEEIGLTIARAVRSGGGYRTQFRQFVGIE